MSTLEDRKREIADMTAYHLADMADCAGPDRPDSAGADFLTGVRDAVLDTFGADEDRVHEIADGAPSVYTHEMWTQFLDLAAYREDPSEFGYGAEDMSKAAAVCLYIIAERLAQTLWDMLREATEDDAM